MIDRYEPEIIKYDVDWNLIKSATMQTVGKDMGKNPTEEWERKMLIAEHSPIRRSMISIRWLEIPSYVANHLCRHHVSVEKFVSTSRSDRTNTDRSERRQTDFVSMQMDFNIQSLMTVMQKRLCMQADPETRKYALGLLKAIAKKDPLLAEYLVPQGIYRAGCPESFANCNYCTNFLNTLSKEQILDLRARLTAYNEHRENQKVKNR